MHIASWVLMEALVIDGWYLPEIEGFFVMNHRNLMAKEDFGKLGYKDNVVEQETPP